MVAAVAGVAGAVVNPVGSGGCGATGLAVDGGDDGGSCGGWRWRTVVARGARRLRRRQWLSRWLGSGGGSD